MSRHKDAHPYDAAGLPPTDPRPRTEAKMSDPKLDRAMDLLARVEASEAPAPDPEWYRDYYLLIGEHMVLTEDGWAHPSAIGEGDPGDYVLSEVNAP